MQKKRVYYPDTIRLMGTSSSAISTGNINNFKLVPNSKIIRFVPRARSLVVEHSADNREVTGPIPVVPN